MLNTTHQGAPESIMCDIIEMRLQRRDERMIGKGNPLRRDGLRRMWHFPALHHQELLASSSLHKEGVSTHLYLVIFKIHFANPSAFLERVKSLKCQKLGNLIDYLNHVTFYFLHFLVALFNCRLCMFSLVWLNCVNIIQNWKNFTKQKQLNFSKSKNRTINSLHIPYFEPKYNNWKF